MYSIMTLRNRTSMSFTDDKNWHMTSLKSGDLGFKHKLHLGLVLSFLRIKKYKWKKEAMHNISSINYKHYNKAMKTISLLSVIKEVFAKTINIF